MVSDNNLEEVEVLTRRFKDYIDKIQRTLQQSEPVLNKPGNSKNNKSKKFYTVVSPVDVMATNLKTVINVLEKAIDNIEMINNTSNQGHADSVDILKKKKTVIESGEGERLFSNEELEFLEKTFNKILNASEKERDKIFEDLDKISS